MTPPTPSDDGELVAQFRAGDAHALEALLQRYEAPLFQFLVGLLRDHHQAEDVLQETWCRALTHLDGVDWGHLRGWLFTVAYHQAMLARRRQKGSVSCPENRQEQLADRAADPVALAEQREEVLRLRALLERLPERQQEVIRQRIYEGKRFREIADTLDCPLNTALARMHEGLKRLRVLWEKDMAERERNGGDLALQALMYAGGALEDAEAVAFEARLGTEQQAREALCHAVELVSSCSGAGAVRPDPAYRDRVRQRLAPPSLLGRWLRPRIYSGHPATWAGLGAASAVVVMTALFWGPLSEGGGTPPGGTAVRAENLSPFAEPGESARAAEAAKIWAELPRSEHLVKAHIEETQRKARAEKLQRLVKTDEGRSRLLAPTPRN